MMGVVACYVTVAAVATSLQTERGGCLLAVTVETATPDIVTSSLAGEGVSLGARNRHSIFYIHVLFLVYIFNIFCYFDICIFLVSILSVHIFFTFSIV